MTRNCVPFIVGSLFRQKVMWDAYLVYLRGVEKVDSGAADSLNAMQFIQFLLPLIHNYACGRVDGCSNNEKKLRSS